MNKIKILATNAKSNCSYWKKNTTIYTEYLDELDAIWGTNKAESLIFSMKWAYKLFKKSRDFTAIVTNSDKASLIFAIMQLFFRRSRRKPHIILFVLWNHPGNIYKRIFYKLIIKSVSKIIVFSKKQQLLHSKAFGVSKNKFPIIHYHTTLRDIEIKISDGDYLFAGGDTCRDYKTLINAMRGLPFKLVIAALHRNHFKNINIPDNISIVSVNADEFLHLIAGCRAIALPLFKNVLQAGGQQTFLNAMAMGKTVIVADDNSASEYIEHGIDGFIVPPEDMNAMRSAIISVMNNQTLCKTIGNNAKIKANNYPVSRFTNKVHSTVMTICDNIASGEEHKL